MRIDEITRFLDCRYILTTEGCLRIFEFNIHYHQLGVEHLTYHLPDEQCITFPDSSNLQGVVNRDGIESTMFTEWMKMNQMDKEARNLTYAKFPTQFVWHKDVK